MVYVIFPDGTSLRDARERVLEYLNYAKDRLPAGVEPKLGPDATGVGWVYQYVLIPATTTRIIRRESGTMSRDNKWYRPAVRRPGGRAATNSSKFAALTSRARRRSRASRCFPATRIPPRFAAFRTGICVSR